MGYDQHTVHDTSFQTQFCCLPLVLANIRLWPLVPFFQISLKNSELKTTHNTFQDCHMHFFQQSFSKQLYMTTITVNLISSMDRALHLVITKVRVRFLGKLKIFFRFLFNHLGCSFYCKDHFHFHIFTCGSKYDSFHMIQFTTVTSYQNYSFVRSTHRPIHNCNHLSKTKFVVNVQQSKQK